MEFKKVEDYVRKNQLIAEGDQVVLGVSGGADSVCLFRMLLTLKERLSFSMKVIHVNHGIRGDEAKRDEQFVEELCRTWNVPMQVVAYDIPSIAKERHLSEEEAGRMMRYQSFYDALESTGGKIAVAHHMDDNAETVLMQLVRGSGIRGLIGMQKKSGAVIRPLLLLRRDEIEAYLRKIGQAYCNDSTNACNQYTRNRVRNQVMPLLGELNRSAVENIVSAAEQLEEIEEYLSEKTDQIWNQVKKQELFGTEGILFPLSMGEESVVLQKRVIRKGMELLAGSLKDITRVHVMDVLALFDKGVGKEVSLPYQMMAKRLYAGVLLQKKGADVMPGVARVLQKEQKYWSAQRAKRPFDETFGEVPLAEGRYVFEDQTELILAIGSPKDFSELNGLFDTKGIMKRLKIEKDGCTKWYDYDKIETVLLLRTRKTGDVLTIHKNGSKKSVKDFLMDAKVPKEHRDDVLMIADGSRILWIPGMRGSEHANVTEDTKRVLKIEWKGGRISDERAD